MKFEGETRSTAERGDRRLGLKGGTCERWSLGKLNGDGPPLRYNLKPDYPVVYNSRKLSSGRCCRLQFQNRTGRDTCVTTQGLQHRMRKASGPWQYGSSQTELHPPDAHLWWAR